MRLLSIAILMLLVTLNLATAKSHNAHRHDSVTTSIQKISKLAADKNWGLAEEVVTASEDPEFAEATLTALMIYYQPNKFSGAELLEFFSKNEWLPVKVFAATIESSMDETRSTPDILAWYHKYAPVTSYGKMIYSYSLIKNGLEQKLYNEEMIRFKEFWLNTKLEPDFENNLITSLKKDLTPADLLKKIEFYTWNNDNNAAERLIKILPEKITIAAKSRIALAKNPKLLKKYLSNSQSFKESDPIVQYLAIKYLHDNEYHKQAAQLIKHVKSKINSEKWYKLRNALAREMIGQGKFKEAYEIIASHGLTAGSDYVDAEFLSGWLSNQFVGDKNKALRHFLNMSKEAKYSASKAKANYWLAQSLNDLQKNDKSKYHLELAAAYKGTFYGHLALAKIAGSKQVEYFSNSLDDPAKGKPKERLSQNILRLAIFTSAIQQAKISSLARKCAEAIVEEEPGYSTIRAIVNYYYKIDQKVLAVELSKIAANKYGIILEEGFPNELPANANLPNKHLYLAIIRQESNFNQSVVSAAGAKGLMQLMPDTAQRMAKKIGLHPRAYEYDGGANVMKGATYFKDLYHNFGDSYILAIASYNAGPGNVKKWLAKYGDPRDKDLDYIVDWLELVPFGETRLYIKKVIENMVVYHSINNDNHQADTIYQFLKYE